MQLFLVVQRGNVRLRWIVGQSAANLTESNFLCQVMGVKNALPSGLSCGGVGLPWRAFCLAYPAVNRNGAADYGDAYQRDDGVLHLRRIGPSQNGPAIANRQRSLD